MRKISKRKSKNLVVREFARKLKGYTRPDHMDSPMDVGTDRFQRENMGHGIDADTREVMLMQYDQTFTINDIFLTPNTFGVKYTMPQFVVKKDDRVFRYLYDLRIARLKKVSSEEPNQVYVFMIGVRNMHKVMEFLGSIEDVQVRVIGNQTAMIFRTYTWRQESEGSGNLNTLFDAVA